MSLDPIRSDPFDPLLQNHVGFELCFHGPGTGCILMRNSSLPEYLQIMQYLKTCLNIYCEQDGQRHIERTYSGQWISPEVFTFRKKTVTIGMTQHGVVGYVQTWIKPSFSFALLSSPNLEIVADLHFLLRHTASEYKYTSDVRLYENVTSFHSRRSCADRRCLPSTLLLEK